MSPAFTLVDNASIEPLAARKRIALIGSAPSSVGLAPYSDPSWTIWACSPGAAPHVKRVDAWFELHPLSDPHAGFSPDYVAWMSALTCPVYLTEQVPAIPAGVVYPRAEMTEKYGPYFFTSSLAWMLALALEQKPDEIGLWGVDMSATEEYLQQRAGCHHFITLAKARGIRITVPAESDLLRSPRQYGFDSNSAMYRKLSTRKAELTKRSAEAAAQYEHYRNEWNFINGALDDLTYIMNTWIE